MAYRHTAISSLPRAVFVTCDQSHLPSYDSFLLVITLQLLPLLPPLRPLVLSSSLIGCQSVQIYNHHSALPISGGKTT
jgi:hypothetical protein